MQVQIGKGITLDVDTTKLNESVMAHVVYIGLRNILMDAHAGESDAEFARAKSEKKLAALLAGEVRTASSREGDPVRAEALRIAMDMVKNALRKAGRKVADVDAKVIREKALTLINDDLLALAKKRVEESKAVAGAADESVLDGI